ncbi:hypothetical protein Taro_046804 [Colocasia esculenta]|uniref:Uncharacterized protein n=1 Tax=Colocasia esculenta TaxID=4460 RepID=A0A843WZL5_COLES|nr:hypothetical protein [Colocasia esculenta]
MAPRRRPREGVAEQATRQEVGDAPPPQQTQPLPQDAHSGIVPPLPPPPQDEESLITTPKGCRNSLSPILSTAATHFAIIPSHSTPQSYSFHYQRSTEREEGDPDDLLERLHILGAVPTPGSHPNGAHLLLPSFLLFLHAFLQTSEIHEKLWFSGQFEDEKKVHTQHLPHSEDAAEEGDATGDASVCADVTSVYRGAHGDRDTSKVHILKPKIPGQHPQSKTTIPDFVPPWSPNGGQTAHRPNWSDLNPHPKTTSDRLPEPPFFPTTAPPARPNEQCDRRKYDGQHE